MRIRMTGVEVAEAIRLWLDDHGIPNNVPAVYIHPDGRQLKLEEIPGEIRMVIDAPHMEGPYR